MKDFWLRIILAIVISISCAFLTHLWGRSHHVRRIAPNDSTPVARIVSTSNEVERRLAQHLIWQSIYRDQELYPGEALRTASKSEARIEFFNGGKGEPTTIDLDPDTAVEIEQTTTGINLDFLKGNLLIHSTGSGTQINLRSGEEFVPLKDADVQLSKSASESPVEVDLIRGQAAEIRRDARLVIKERKLTMIKPDPSRLLYSEPGQAQPVEITWKPIDHSYFVTLEAGASRFDLHQVSAIAPVPGDKGKLLFPLTVGKTYFRLRARLATNGRGVASQNLATEVSFDEQNALESSVRGVSVHAKLPALLTEPANGAVLHPLDSAKQVVLRWTNPGKLNGLLLEISSSQDFKNLVDAEHLEKALSVPVSFKGKKSARYYWRVSGEVPATGQMLPSRAQYFDLETSDKLKPQLVLTSTPNAVPDVTAELPVLPAVLPPVLQVVEAPVLPAVPGPTPSLPPLPKHEPPTLADSKTVLKAGDPLPPKIKPLTDSVLKWKDGLTKVKTIYRSKHPELNISWEKGPSEAGNYRVRLSDASVDIRQLKKSEWRTVDQPHYEETLEGPGTYRIEVESRNEAGKIVAHAPPRTQEFVEAPRPGPPAFDANLGDPVQASDHGSVDLAWSKVEEAKEYVVQIKTSQGDTIRAPKTSITSLQLTHLKPGEYIVTLQSVDGFGRDGSESKPRKLIVPVYSDLQAPRLKNVNIK